MRAKLEFRADRDSGRDRGPDGRAAEPGRAVRGAARGGGADRAWSTTGGAQTRRCPFRRVCAWCVRRGRGAGPPRRATPAGGRAARTGSPSSTTTSSPRPAGCDALAADLAAAGPDVAGVQGRVVVPLPADRRPTDWERNTRGLERARWATADLAYRRAALEAAGGFDERFPRAYREDADLGLRITAAGRRIVTGERSGPAPGAPRTGVGVGGQAGRQRRRRADAGAARARLARPGGRAGGSPSAASRGRGRRRAVAGRARRAPSARRRRRGRRVARRDGRAGLGADRARPAHAARGGDDAVDERGDPVRGVGLVAGRPRDPPAPPARAKISRRHSGVDRQWPRLKGSDPS